MACMLGPADTQETEGLFESRLLSSVWTIKKPMSQEQKSSQIIHVSALIYLILC